MSITATPKSVEQLVTDREATIAQAMEEIAKLEDAKSRNDSKARLSAGGRLANRVREIGEIELELAMQGHEVEPWEKPTTSTTRMEPLTQAEIEDNLAKVTEVWRTTRFDKTKSNADQRIQALLKAADKRGYTITDPRKAKAPKAN